MTHANPDREGARGDRALSNPPRTRRAWVGDPFVVFAACAVAVIVAMLGLTWHVLRLERTERAARAEARFQESIRLVLWRMDSAVSSIIGIESARPYFEYQAFYPAGRPYEKMLDDRNDHDLLVPSPLLRGTQRFVQLHFQRDAAGRIESPQAPSGDLRLIADSIAGSPTPAAAAESKLDSLRLLMAARRSTPEPLALNAAHSSQERESKKDEAPRDEALDTDKPVTSASGSLDSLSKRGPAATEYAARQQVAEFASGAGNILNSYRNQKQISVPLIPLPPPAPAAASAAAVDRKVVDRFDASPDLKDNAITGAIRVSERDQTPITTLAASTPPTSPPVLLSSATDGIEVGAFVARWLDSGTGSPQLVYTRQLRSGAKIIEQGLWIDWESLRQWLVSSATDLLPDCTLRPLRLPHEDGETLGTRLASLPAELVPGIIPEGPMPAWSPMRTTLVFCWIGVLVAIGAIAAVLRASQDLASRRGRFVTAVTHELRTPLTTFCLYSQMLADGMVKEEDARREYLVTLKNESIRLAGIVESVLEYARLGRVTPRATDAISAKELVSAVEPGLHRRAERVGMELRVSCELDDAPQVRTDAATVDRILGNLVDNACKYALEPGGVIRLEATSDARNLYLTVRDHGPGIAPSERRRIFRPFHRASEHAHGGIPGLGLGLALASGLAEQIGGELRLEDSNEPGAAFLLAIPLANAQTHRA